MDPRLFAIAFFFVTFLPAVPFAQDLKNDKSFDQPVNIVTNVMVTDPDGNPVNDLTKGDIRVFEDGVEQHVSYFARRDPVLHVGFVVDNTGSMHEQMKRVIDISKLITSNLREKDEAFILRFVGRDKITLEQDWTSDKAWLNKEFDSMFIEGGSSAVVDGLYLAEEKISQRTKESSAGRYALVLISDCEDRDSYYNLEQLLAILRPTDIQVFVIALTTRLSGSVGFINANGRNKADNFANMIALRTGGAVLIPFNEENRKKQLADAIKPLVNELHANYVIGYTSSNTQWDGKTRSLRVEIADDPKGKKRQGFTRESLVVPTH